MPSSIDKIRRNIIFASCLWIILLPILVARFYYIQIVRHDFYLGEARRRYVAETTTMGKRGEIFEASGDLLVANSPRITVICSPYSSVYEPFEGMRNSRYPQYRKLAPIRVEQRRRLLAWLINKHFGGGFEDNYNRLEPFTAKLDKDRKPILDRNGNVSLRKNQYWVVGRDYEIDRVREFRAQLSKNKLPQGGFRFEDVLVRTYPKGRLLANVLGFSNVSNDQTIPQGGLEKKLADDIKPEAGKIGYEHFPDGTPLDDSFQLIKASRDGKNIYLTIREPIQAILEDELDTSYAEWKPDTLYAAIVNPRNGNILALSQRPNFDPNDRSTFSSKSSQTRIAEDIYEPGSIMKPFTVAKALDWGVVQPDDIIDCERGLWMFCGRKLTDSHPYDKLTVAGVIQKSSNIGTAKIAVAVGIERFNEIIKLFQFGKRTNLPFPVESRGLVPKLKSNQALSLSRMSIGYSISPTPLQLIRAYCALANGGNMPQLRLIDRIKDPATGKETIMPFAPMTKTINNQRALQELVKMMIMVTEKGGTATKAAVKGYHVAGKTGTSRKSKGRGGYASNEHFSSFVGFVPATRPEFVMLVTMDNPKGASYGGVVAAPTFKRTAERVLRYLNVPPDKPEELPLASTL